MFTFAKLRSSFRVRLYFLRLPELASFESAQAAPNVIAHEKARDTRDPYDKLPERFVNVTGKLPERFVNVLERY